MKTDGQRFVVVEFSKRPSPAESKYHSFDFETVAVVKGVSNTMCNIFMADSLLSLGTVIQ